MASKHQGLTPLPEIISAILVLTLYKTLQHLSLTTFSSEFGQEFLAFVHTEVSLFIQSHILRPSFHSIKVKVFQHGQSFLDLELPIYNALNP